MRQRTKAAAAVIAHLYATMASAAAQRAVKRIEFGDANEAGIWADVAVKYIDKTSADALRWTYERPRRNS